MVVGAYDGGEVREVDDIVVIGVHVIENFLGVVMLADRSILFNNPQSSPLRRKTEVSLELDETDIVVLHGVDHY